MMKTLAITPPMGWNSWDCWGAAVNEDTVLKNAAFMAEHLKEYGWEYVVVDIEWYQPSVRTHDYIPFAELCMDAYGRLQPAVNRFPSAADGRGFGPLADRIHAMGLKFGIHIMRGLPRMAAHRRLPILNADGTCADAADPNSVCAWNPDMYGLKCGLPLAAAWYRSIFEQYAEWGVDYVKCDDIAREYPRCEKEIEVISDACRSCGRDIVLSLSPGPAPIEKAEHLKKYANLWRITDDFWDEWRLLKGMFERAGTWCVHAGPGHWPDADMLPLGALRQCWNREDRTRFTRDEQRTMMTLWCMMRSPLMLGADLTVPDDFMLSLLTNREVMGIEKSVFCSRPLRTTPEEAAWIAPRRDGSGLYAAVFNLSDETRKVSIAPEELEIPFTAARELWTGRQDLSCSAVLPPHGCALWRLTR